MAAKRPGPRRPSAASAGKKNSKPRTTEDITSKDGTSGEPPARAPSDGLDELKGLPLFAAVVAHELRNPLSAVKIALQTLERQEVPSAKDSTRLRIALREVATIERVLTDVLDWARPPAIAVETVAPRQLFERALELAARDVAERRLQLQLDLAPDLPPVAADPQRAAQALAELVRNAAQASPVEGLVHLSAERQDGWVAFGVEDQGPGLTSEELARAFDPFFSRRARGVGLGLPRARDTARRHGGELLLERSAAGGLRALLLLPVAPA